jgi:hypothetical protein
MLDLDQQDSRSTTVSSYQDAIAKIAPEIAKYGGYLSITPMKDDSVTHRHDMDADAWRLRIQDNGPTGGMNIIAQGSPEAPIDDAFLAVLEELPRLKLSYFELEDGSKTPLKGNKSWEDFTSALQEAADQDARYLEEQRERAAAYPDDAEEVEAVGYLERSISGLAKLKSLVREAIDQRNAMQAPGPR